VKLAFLDVFCGLSGDMFLGALIDAGVSPNMLMAELRKIPLEGWTLQTQHVRKQGLRGLKVHIAVEPAPQAALNADEIIALIRQSNLQPQLIERAVNVIERIAQAEAHVHGVERHHVHFHELGGVDTILDVCGVLIGLELLGIEKLFCSALPMSHGYVETAHGRLPVPPPAVAYLLQGVPVYPLDVEGETVTPTGAALAVCLAEFGPCPPMTITATGMGAGMKDFPLPNLLRLFVGETSSAAATGWIELLEANVDDMSGEFFGFAMERIFAAGALDVWATPILMKKNRPAIMLSALAEPAKADSVAEAIFQHTTTLGVRRQLLQRDCLTREHIFVNTSYGPIRIKLGQRGEHLLTAAPEYEDCAAAALRHNVSLKKVYAAAQAAYIAAQESKKNA